ncbi:hypothetical protein HK405_013321 [Cladochytrium tenue]|nr:hypothetical protein HK405_013321 [Cladochytrium tenue]
MRELREPANINVRLPTDAVSSGTPAVLAKTGGSVQSHRWSAKGAATAGSGTVAAPKAANTSRDALAVATDAVASGLPRLVVGALFGLTLGKARMHWPAVISGQLRLEAAGMAQMFLAATVSGMVALAVMERRGLFRRSVRAPVSCGMVGSSTFAANWGCGNVVGGTVLGMGMAVAGACPGTLLVQLGAGIPSAPYAVAGGVLAALAHAYAEAALRRRWLPRLGEPSGAALAVDELVAARGEGGKDGSSDRRGNVYGTIAAGTAAVVLPLVAVLATVLPHAEHLRRILVAGQQPAESRLGDASMWPWVDAPLWQPVTAGLVIGLVVQPASVLVSGSALGMSGVYPYWAAQMLTTAGAAGDRLQKWLWPVTAAAEDGTRAPELPAGLARSSGAHATGWTAVGTVLGGFLATLMSGGYGPAEVGELPSRTAAVVGGALLVLGARIAGGCTSGHGISGCAQLGVASMVTVASMFAGGVVMARCLQFVGLSASAL